MSNHHERRAVGREPSGEDLVEPRFLEHGLGDQGERPERGEGGDLFFLFFLKGGKKRRRTIEVSESERERGRRLVDDRLLLENAQNYRCPNHPQLTWAWMYSTAAAPLTAPREMSTATPKVSSHLMMGTLALMTMGRPHTSLALRRAFNSSFRRFWRSSRWSLRVCGPF